MKYIVNATKANASGQLSKLRMQQLINRPNKHEDNTDDDDVSVPGSDMEKDLEKP
ncbi:hypothetical protein HDV00_012530, partial [Rhizophlyctis rosea]